MTLLGNPICLGAGPGAGPGGPKGRFLGEPRPRLLPARFRLLPTGRALCPGLGHHATCTLPASPSPATATDTRISPRSPLRGQGATPLPSTLPGHENTPHPTGSVLWKMQEGGHSSRGGRASNRRWSTALGVYVCGWGEIKAP